MNRILFLFILICLVSSCGSDDTVTTPAIFTYAVPTESEIRSIETIVTSRDRSPRDVEIVYQKVMADKREVRLYRHRVANHDHYGAVIIPSNSTREKIPVAIIASGRSVDPTLYTIMWMNFAEVVDPAFNDMILVIPSYRSRELEFESQFFQSTGDPCDAWDGSSDDTIALLNVALDQIPQADEEKIIILGVSRGATIAHLVGQRDSRISMIIAASGRVNFNRPEYQGPFFSV